MSFAFMPVYTGDYLRDTRHLTPMRHGIYLLALMHCWDQRGPMPLDEQECAGVCNCRSADEIDALRYVIGRFFIRMEDGHYNSRLQREIERSNAISGARSEAGKAGALARAKQLPSKRQALAKQVPLSPPPPPQPTQEEKTTRASRTSPFPPGLESVSAEVRQDWIAMRKAKRAAVTPTAIRGIQREADKAGMTLEAALAMCCARGWTGFKAEWTESAKTAMVHTPMTAHSRAADATAEYLRRQSEQVALSRAEAEARRTKNGAT
jgi:uncharacterized protein YdaU (DUF1376 family)